MNGYFHMARAKRGTPYMYDNHSSADVFTHLYYPYVAAIKEIYISCYTIHHITIVIYLHNTIGTV